MKDTTKLTGLFRLRVSFAASSSIQGVAELAHGVSASLRANAVATLNTAGPVASSILFCYNSLKNVHIRHVKSNKAEIV